MLDLLKNIISLKLTNRKGFRVVLHSHSHAVSILKIPFLFYFYYEVADLSRVHTILNRVLAII